MELKEIEVLTDLSNYAIVRMPGRNFPGCVIQGDSLSILLNSANCAHTMALKTGHQDLIDEVASLRDALEERLKHYENVIRAHGYDLPYGRPRTG